MSEKCMLCKQKTLFGVSVSLPYDLLSNKPSFSGPIMSQYACRMRTICKSCHCLFVEHELEFLGVQQIYDWDLNDESNNTKRPSWQRQKPVGKSPSLKEWWRDKTRKQR